MRIALVANQVPFLRSETDLLAARLKMELEGSGSICEIVRLPFRQLPSQRALEQMLAARLTTIPLADRVVALAFPACAVEHGRKLVWLLERPTDPLEDSPSWPEPASVRARACVLMARMERLSVCEAERLLAASAQAAERLRDLSGVHAEVLYPPLADTSGLRCESFGDYVFCPSRLDLAKRQRLLIESMAHVRSEVRLVLAGAASKPERVGELEQLIASLGVGERVELIGSWISEERKQELFANALACAYIPYGEDSYGYVTLESYHSLKPVVTCRDSGGTLEIVEDEVTGLVCEPEPQELAQAFDRLHGSPELARRLGRAGHERMLAMEISWEHVVERLLA